MDAAQRRVRLVDRHRLGGGARSALEATRSVVALHATDPATVYLSVMARARTLGIEGIGEELYESQQLVRMMAMRRTLFVVPAHDVPSFQSGVSSAVAATIRRRLVKELCTGPTDPALPDDPDEVEEWLRSLERDVVRYVEAAGPVDGAGIAKAVPGLSTALLPRTTKAYDVRRAITSRVLTLMGTDGHLVRGRPSGSWTSRRHTWESVTGLFPDGVPDRDPDQARGEVATAYLRAFGPVTEIDVAWWTGWALGVTRRTLAALETVETGPGLIELADDADPDGTEPTAPVAALLPALDPTPMGWKERGWFLPEDSTLLYDRFGNVGPTVWWDGEVIGYWAVRTDGQVATALLTDRGAEASAAVAEQAGRLTTRLDGAVVVPSFPTPGAQALAAT